MTSVAFLYAGGFDALSGLQRARLPDSQNYRTIQSTDRFL